MAKFSCTVCSSEFVVPDQALEKYPGWKPKYCKEHSPKKASDPSKSKSFASVTLLNDLTLEEVLERFSEGPDSGLFTDGSSRPNPGPGGWAAVWVQNGKLENHAYGSETNTTNNRMELTAIIEGLKYESIPPKVRSF